MDLDQTWPHDSPVEGEKPYLYRRVYFVMHTFLVNIQIKKNKKFFDKVFDAGLHIMGRSPNYGRNSNIFHISNGLNSLHRK